MTEKIIHYFSLKHPNFLARVYKILLAICARFWHPVSYILHVLPYQGLFHLFGQNFGQTRGPRCCNFRRGNSASYFRGERCDRWGLAVGRKLTEKVKKAPTRYFMQNITRWTPKDCANRPQISCKLGLEQVPGQCRDRPGCIHAFATINDSPFFSRIFI